MVADKKESLPAVQRDEAPKKKLTAGELDKSLERLYSRSFESHSKRNEEHKKAVEEQLTHNKLKPAPKGELTAEEQKRLQHLYFQPLEKKRMEGDRKATKEGAATAADTNTKVVTAEEKEAITERLYTQARTQAEASQAASQKKVYGEAERRQLSNEEVKARVDSLYFKAIEKKKTSMQELEDKYLWKMQVSEKKLSPADVAALAERLNKKS
jgi:hypothetical protein